MRPPRISHDCTSQCPHKHLVSCETKHVSISRTRLLVIYLRTFTARQNQCGCKCCYESVSHLNSQLTNFSSKPLQSRQLLIFGNLSNYQCAQCSQLCHYCCCRYYLCMYILLGWRGSRRTPFNWQDCHQSKTMPTICYEDLDNVHIISLMSFDL